MINPHDFSGGFHLRPQENIHIGKAAEGEDRFLDGNVIRMEGRREVEVFQGFSQHDLRRQFRQRHANGLADKGNGPGGTGVHFQNIEHSVLDGILNIHETDHPQLFRDHLCLFFNKIEKVL